MEVLRLLVDTFQVDVDAQSRTPADFEAEIDATLWTTVGVEPISGLNTTLHELGYGQALVECNAGYSVLISQGCRSRSNQQGWADVFETYYRVHTCGNLRCGSYQGVRGMRIRRREVLVLRTICRKIARIGNKTFWPIRTYVLCLPPSHSSIQIILEGLIMKEDILYFL